MQITLMASLLTCCGLTLLNAENPSGQPLSPSPKPNEIWWEKNLGNLVSFEVFETWLGDMNAPSRVAMRMHLMEKGYKTILDAACGLGIDYLGMQKEGLEIDYKGLDITPKLIAYGQSLHIPVLHASVEKIPFDDSSVEFAYARHLLEHLTTYKTALNEMIRVASKEVGVIFFIRPLLAENDVINSSQNLESLLFNNQYSQIKIEKFLSDHLKVASIQWQDINDQEVMLHVYLKND